MEKLPEGSFTALVTPFLPNGEIDEETFAKNIEFQRDEGSEGIVPAGTTGESATLKHDEHNDPIHLAVKYAKDGLFVLAGTGSNCTAEAMHYTGEAARAGVKGVLLVEPYYNAPSSREILEEYFIPLAKAFPDVLMVPYFVPGRTGCNFLISHIVKLATECPNVKAIKEATGNLDRMAKERSLLPSGVEIFSGDDSLNLEIISRPDIRGKGVISVVSNIAPWACADMCDAVFTGDLDRAKERNQALQPLNDVVTVKYINDQGEADRSKNPRPIKALMYVLGMLGPGCRQPLGKMEKEAVKILRQAIEKVWNTTPGILLPIEDFFGVSITKRLATDSLWNDLTY